MIDTKGLLTVKQYADYRNISRQRGYKMIRQRVERIEGVLLRILNLVEPLILDRDKPHVNPLKPDLGMGDQGKAHE
jgi:hypothetical protein